MVRGNALARTGVAPMVGRARGGIVRLKRLGVGMVLGLLSLLMMAVLLRPPTGGYYRSRLCTILDGSVGYVHLRDGIVYSVNVGGDTGASRRRIGTYTHAGDRSVTFRLAVGGYPDYTTQIGWLGFSWNPDWCPGHPGHPEWNVRVVNPLRIRTLDGIR